MLSLYCNWATHSNVRLVAVAGTWSNSVFSHVGWLKSLFPPICASGFPIYCWYCILEILTLKKIKTKTCFVCQHWRDPYCSMISWHVPVCKWLKKKLRTHLQICTGFLRHSSKQQEDDSVPSSQGSSATVFSSNGRLCPHIWLSVWEDM